MTMEQRIDELEKMVHELEAKWGKVAYWFTDRPELDNYVSPSAVAFRVYLDSLESKSELGISANAPSECASCADNETSDEVTARIKRTYDAFHDAIGRVLRERY